MEINSLTGTGPAQSSRGSQPVSASKSPPVSTPRTPESSSDVSAKPVAPTAPAEVSDINKVVDAINKRLQPVTGNIQFSVDQDSGQTIIQIVDKQTKTVLLQIPSKQALEIAKEFDKLQGLLIKEKA